MNSPKISICIPAYKTPEILIRRAIDFILKQSFKDFEIVIVNDGADLILKNIIFSYRNTVNVDYGCNLDAKIRYFETDKPHGGGAYATNVCLKNAQGDFVLFHDHDDYLFYPQNPLLALETMYNEVQNTNTDILFFNYFYHSKKIEENIPFRPIDIFSSDFSDSDMVELEKYFLQTLLPIWNKLFRRKFLIDNNLYFDEVLKITEDDEFYFRYIFKTTNIKFSDNCYYCYTVNNTSMSSVQRNSDYLDFISYSKMVNTLKSYDIYDKCKIFLLNNFLHLMQYAYPIKILFTEKNPLKVKKYIKDCLDVSEKDLISLQKYKFRFSGCVSYLMFFI